jgi:hypothetical protein
MKFITLQIYSDLHIQVNTISNVKNTMQTIVNPKNASSPSLLTVKTLMSSPKRAYMVTIAIVIEKGRLSIKFEIFVV